jgi:hypothetical protein
MVKLTAVTSLKSMLRLVISNDKVGTSYERVPIIILPS